MQPDFLNVMHSHIHKQTSIQTSLFTLLALYSKVFVGIVFINNYSIILMKLKTRTDKVQVQETLKHHTHLHDFFLGKRVKAAAPAEATTPAATLRSLDNLFFIEMPKNVSATESK